jgi:glycosyltransferase involved in cell wall biosynthesis
MLGDRYLQHRFQTGRVNIQEVVRGLAVRAIQIVKQGNYDVAWLQCELIPFAPGLVEAGLMRIPYIYDFDDAFQVKYRSGRFERFSPLLADKFDHVVRKASAVLPGNNYLYQYARRLNQNCTIVPTVVDHTKYLRRYGERDPDVFNVGWIGSPSSIKCLKAIARPLAILAKETPVRFTVIGGIAPAIDGVEVVNVPWSEITEIEDIRHFDVGVMPLPDDSWTRGKCAFKLIQYMACGVPVVGSPVGANCDVITRDCGLLASSDQEWLKAFRFVRDNPVVADKMGNAGRSRVASVYSLESQLPVVERALRSVVS